MIRSHSSSDVGSRLGLRLGAGVVEGVVQAPERFDCLGQRGLDVGAAGHVTVDGEGLATEVLDHPSRALAALLVDVGDDDLGAVASECHPAGPTLVDGGGAAAEDRRFAGDLGDCQSESTPVW